MIKSSNMTPKQRKAAAEYLNALEMDDDLSPDEVEVILDHLVDMGLAEKCADGRWRLAKGVRVITDENDYGE